MSGPIAPFRERYRKALADPQLRSSLLSFQRAWRSSRQAAFEHLEQRAGLGVAESSFAGQRERLTEAKNVALEERAAQFERFKSAASAAGAVVYESSSAQEASHAATAAASRSQPPTWPGSSSRGPLTGPRSDTRPPQAGQRQVTDGP